MSLVTSWVARNTVNQRKGRSLHRWNFPCNWFILSWIFGANGTKKRVKWTVGRSKNGGGHTIELLRSHIQMLPTSALSRWIYLSDFLHLWLQLKSNPCDCKWSDSVMLKASGLVLPFKFSQFSSVLIRPFSTLKHICDYRPTCQSRSLSYWEKWNENSLLCRHWIQWEPILTPPVLKLSNHLLQCVYSNVSTGEWRHFS